MSAVHSRGDTARAVKFESKLDAIVSTRHEGARSGNSSTESKDTRPDEMRAQKHLVHTSTFWNIRRCFLVRNPSCAFLCSFFFDVLKITRNRQN